MKFQLNSLKGRAEVLTLPLRNIINLLMKLSSLGENFEIANLKHFFKKGTGSDPKNSLHILLLSFLSKLIEKSTHLMYMCHLAI